MKRGVVTFVSFGIAFGLFLTWLSLYVGSHIDWHRGPRPGGCMDRGDCSWWGASLLVGYVLLPPMLFGALNGVAWKRWTILEWGGWFAALSILTVVLHLASYALP